MPDRPSDDVTRPDDLVVDEHGDPVPGDAGLDLDEVLAILDGLPEDGEAELDDDEDDEGRELEEDLGGDLADGDLAAGPERAGLGGAAGSRERSASDGEPEGERLQKVLALAGFGSRRVCENLVAAGRVQVDGEVAELGRRVRPDVDRVTVDGIPITLPDLVHRLLNKPPGYVTTSSDPQGRRIIFDLLPSEPRTFPVGRLDYDSEGLLIVTNDGELAHALTHPSTGVPKTYLADVDGEPIAATMRQLVAGVELDDGPAAADAARVVARRPGGAAVEIVLHEGRNRQVRRMLEVVGHPVRRLVRTRIGPLVDHTLAPGAWRDLTIDEVRALYAAAGIGKAEPIQPRRR
jgi:23S rRNA pseudouridine2605 synthase